MAVKQMLVGFAEAVHLKLFGHKMSDEMRRFIANLTWSFLTGIMVMLVTFTVNILAGRLIGPEDYGKYNLVLVISSYFLVPIYMGLDLASVRAIAGSKDQKEVGQNISSTLVFILFSTTLVILLAVILERPLAKLFSTNAQLIHYTIFFTAFLVIKMILDGCVRGIKKFKLQFMGRLVEMTLYIIFFIVFFLITKQLNYQSYIYIIVIGAAALSVFYFFNLREYFVKPSLEKIRHQLSYGKLLALTAALTTIFVSLDKLLINRYLSDYSLGIYVAYYTVSVTLSLQIVQMFNNVFFPSIAKDMNKSVLAKIDKLTLVGIVPIFAISVILIDLLMRVYGKKFGIQLDLVIIFALLGTVQIITNIYYSIILTFEKKIYKKYLLYSNLANLFTVLIFIVLVLVGRVSIEYITLALVLNYLLVFAIQKRLIKRTFCDKVNA